MKSFSDHEALWTEVKMALPDGGVVGISGFGGSGKSTLAIKIGRDKTGIQLVHVDDYLNWPRVCQLMDAGAEDDGIDFHSIREAHIDPLHSGTKPVEYVIVEGIRLFKPGRVEFFDYCVWVDKSQGEAEDLGRARAQEFNNASKWDIWSQNETSFNEMYQPRQYADALYEWSLDE